MDQSSSLRIGLAVALGLLLATIDRSLARLAGIDALFPAGSYAWPSALYAFDVLAMVAALRLVGGVGRAVQVAALGPWSPRPAVLGWAALIFAPVLAGLALAVGPARPDGDALVMGGVVFPAIEEILYRGLAAGVLLRVAGWRLLPAALLPALFFGVGHAAQGESLGDAALLTLVTGVGGLFFTWLYRRWGDDLWPPFLIHAGLNLQWTLFGLGDNAIGGTAGNLARGAVIAGATIGTLWWLRRTVR